MKFLPDHNNSLSQDYNTVDNLLEIQNLEDISRTKMH